MPQVNKKKFNARKRFLKWYCHSATSIRWGEEGLVRFINKIYKEGYKQGTEDKGKEFLF